MSTYTVTRGIAIDAGHRIMTHGSKCRHLHGHRYVVEAECQAGHLVEDGGEQTDMVLDFGFLKEEMLARIDAFCDHGFIANIADSALLAMFAPKEEEAGWQRRCAAEVRAHGFFLDECNCLGTKLYLVPFNPTAECLARHWFERLEEPVRRRSGGLARLVRISVWETPNCRADYQP
ncbi:MAG: 6-carboxytetrahydropterin synthase [Rhodospirillales bacterium]|nr:6-carboxytetrahydropterin synthase [Rhodospirillales bacterium]